MSVRSLTCKTTTALCPSSYPTNSVKTLKDTKSNDTNHKQYPSVLILINQMTQKGRDATISLMLASTAVTLLTNSTAPHLAVTYKFTRCCYWVVYCSMHNYTESYTKQQNHD